MSAHISEPEKHGKSSGEEESLTTLLDEEQRGELTLLIASAMATMRNTITSSFDPDLGISDQLANLALASEDEKISNTSVDPAKADVSKAEAEKKAKEQLVKEIESPRMQELKEATIAFFDDWRGKVISRVGEVVNSREQAAHQKPKAHQHGKPIPTQEDKKVDAESQKDESAEASLQKLYPPIPSPLASLDSKTRLLIVHSTLLLLISLEHYIAPSRILLLYLTSSLHIPLHIFVEDEEKVAKGLLEAAKQMTGDEEAKKKVEANASTRKWKVGLASVAGAALIGVTGGLAAPLVAAGVGSVMGGIGLGATAAAGYLGTVAGSTVIVGGLFGAYGGRMTGQMMDNYAREVEDFAFVPLQKDGKTDLKRPQSSDDKAGQSDPASRRLRVTIGITGWLTDPNQVHSPWTVLSRSTAEPFALRWELEALLQLGNSLDALVSSAAWGYAKHELISRTVFAGVANAVAWPMTILSLGKLADNPFSIARSRADKAGEVLADALINKAQGERPVTLIGYSMGARVIYACLNSLAKRRAFGLIESAVLIGAPCPSTTVEWRTIRTAVSGRLINVYSENDYVLRFLYRTSSMQYSVAGLSKIAGLPSIENVDVSSTVNGHLRYRHLVGSILSQLGFEDLDMTEVEKEKAAFAKLVEEEERQSYADTAKERSQKVLNDNPLGVDAGGKKTASGSKKTDEEQEKESKEAEAEAERLEKQVQEKTQQSLMSSVSAKLPSFGGQSQPSTAEGERAKEDTKKVEEQGGFLGSIKGGFAGLTK